MKNILSHPSQEIRNAAVRLLDVLSQYERSTRTDYIVIIKTSDGYQYRSLSGGPASPRDSDAQLLESFSSLVPDSVR